MKTLIIFSIILSGCASLVSQKELTPEQSESLSYLKSTMTEANQSGRSLDQLQMNNASRVPRAN